MSSQLSRGLGRGEKPAAPVTLIAVIGIRKMKEIVFQYAVSVVQWASTVPFNIKVYLFGSYINGVPTSESDLDIALEFKDKEQIEDREHLWFKFHSYWEKQLIKLLPNIKIHLCLYDGAEYYKKRKKTDFLTTKESRLIFDSANVLFGKAKKSGQKRNRKEGFLLRHFTDRWPVKVKLFLIVILFSFLTSCHPTFYLTARDISDLSHPCFNISQGIFLPFAPGLQSLLLVSEVDKSGKEVRTMWAIDPIANVNVKEFCYGKAPDGFKEISPAIPLEPDKYYAIVPLLTYIKLSVESGQNKVEIYDHSEFHRKTENQKHP